jgi:hypothetical protein
MPTKIDPTLYVRVGTAADLANVSLQWMLQHVQTGKIPGIEIDGQWFALRSAALAFERHPHAGPPSPSLQSAHAPPESPWTRARF